MTDWLAGVLALARAAAIAYLGYVALLFVLQRTVVYPGTRRAPPRPSPAVIPPGARQLWLETEPGRVEAWLLEGAADGRRPAIVFAHGNGELIDDWLAPMDALRRQGIHVLLVEFPGYGFSGGRPGRRALRAVYAEAYDRLQADPAVDPERIVAMGRSLGGGVAADLALDRPVRALVLLSTFTSAGAVAWNGFRFPPFLVRDRFDNRAALREFGGPVLVLHGRADDVIPFGHAERLARTGAGSEVLALDCAHNDCLVAWPQVVGGVVSFLDEHGLRGREAP